MSEDIERQILSVVHGYISKSFLDNLALSTIELEKPSLSCTSALEQNVFVTPCP